jgi:DNA-binding CsgD family transcriptional regulator
MPSKQLQLLLPVERVNQELTPIEKQVIECLCVGKVAKEITFELQGKSRREFYNYYNKIKIKLGAKTKEHAVAIYASKNPELVKQLLERIK